MPPVKKHQAKALEKKLAFKKKHVFDVLSEKDERELEGLRNDYKDFLTVAKTEREAAATLRELAINAGFSDTGDGKKIFRVYRNKVIGLAVLGNESVEKGVNLVISHTDAPRLDLKQMPLYDDCNIALAKTHYYGGIKKYQWVTRPLALHGVVINSEGKTIEMVIGEKEGDPVFTVLDLLPHLSKKVQMGKRIDEAIIGEKLNLVLGGIPYGGDKVKRRFKLNILKLLNEQYGLVEEDLVSAEFEAVPAGPARDVGLDRAFIGGYGHDDRVSAFSSFRALVSAKPGKRVQVVICVDKEEIGSYGNTGAQGRFVLDFIGELLEREGKTDERSIRRAMANSTILSADVSAAVNPDWQQVHDRLNAAYTGHGIVLTKFTGARGKAGASDASAELVGRIRNLWNQNNVLWQSAELGRVDEGGGGTVAHYLAKYGADVLDAGVAVLAMHAPMEVIHVGDLFMATKAYRVFLEKA